MVKYFVVHIIVYLLLSIERVTKFFRFGILVINLGPIGHCVPTTPTTDLPALPSNNPTTPTLLVNNVPQYRSAQLNACSSDNCLNGGTCQGFDTNYTCICASGYQGLTLLSM